MIDHVSVRVQDLPKLAAFYREALAPIGYKVIMEYPGAIGLGSEMPDLWLMQTDQTLNPTHLALSAAREAIDAFHAAAIAAGGTDNGAPGVRADYHPYYYAAYIIDPEGNNVEVVSHLPPGMPPVPKKKAAARRARPTGKSKTKAKAKKAAKPAKKAAAKTAKKSKPSKKRR